MDENNESIIKDPPYNVSLTVLNAVLEKLAALCKSFHKSCLTTVEAHQLVKAKIANTSENAC